MSELTICKNCKYYTAAIYHGYPFPIDFPAWCSAREHKTINVVTGDDRWIGATQCDNKNNGHCPDYEYQSKPLFVIIPCEPRKHWWQK